MESSQEKYQRLKGELAHWRALQFEIRPDLVLVAEAIAVEHPRLGSLIWNMRDDELRRRLATQFGEQIADSLIQLAGALQQEAIPQLERHDLTGRDVHAAVTLGSLFPEVETEDEDKDDDDSQHCGNLSATAFADLLAWGHHAGTAMGLNFELPKYTELLVRLAEFEGSLEFQDEEFATTLRHRMHLIADDILVLPRNDQRRRYCDDAFGELAEDYGAPGADTVMTVAICLAAHMDTPGAALFPNVRAHALRLITAVRRILDILTEANGDKEGQAALHE